MPDRERRKMLLVTVPTGLLLFGVGGSAMVASKWGLDRPDVLSGAGAGVALVCVMVFAVVRRWKRPRDAGELNRSRAMTTGIRSAPSIGVLAACGLAINGLLRGRAAPFIYMMLVAMMTGATILAGALAWARKGLYQDDDR